MAAQIEYGGAPWLKPYQREAIFNDSRIAIVEAATKIGKGHPLSALILTPAGPVPMREIQDGAVILAADGTQTEVVATYPLGEREIYQVTFSDGSVAECTKDHLWQIHTYRGAAKVVETSELLSMTSSQLRRRWVPTAAPASFDDQAVPLDPYLVGALIGDGGLTTASVRFSNIDSHVLDRVAAALPPNYRLKHVAGCDYTLTLTRPYQLVDESERLGPQLRTLGLHGRGSHEKFIPTCYRYNSVEVRLEILRGIFDTDGSLDVSGQPILEQTSAQLAADVREVVESLGGHCRIRIKANGPGRPVYRLRVVHADAATFFSLPSKKARCRPKSKPVRRFLRSVALVRREEAQCIEVAHPDRLYLAAGCIVTHNTISCLAWLLEQAVKNGKPGRNFWWVAPVYTQAEIAFRRMKRALPDGVYRANESRLRITLANGAILEFRSAERPDTLYGEDVFACVLDEASRMRPEAWYAVRSTLTATQGPVRIIGNVRGRKNWFFRLARAAEDGDPDMTFARMTGYEAAQAGVLKKEEIDAARRDFERLGKLDVFKELYLAEASEDGANPFGLKAIDACVVDGLSRERPRAAGVDFAGRGATNVTDSSERANLDYTAIVMLDRAGYATHIEKFRAPNAETMQRVEQVVARTPSLGDSTGAGDPLIEMLQRGGKMMIEGYVFKPRTKQDLMERLAVAIQNQEVHFPDGELRDELDSFEFEYTRSGVAYSAPQGLHDDLVCGLALAVWKLPRNRTVGAPMGIAGTSRWRDSPDSGQRDEVGPVGPAVIGGRGTSKWDV